MEGARTQGIAQYLTFQLDHELFAIDIASVREVLEFSSVTKVPRTPDFMRGVINLRGNVVPVVDMRIKLGMSPTEKSVDTCVVITEITMEKEKVTLGALVDSVQEVIDLDGSQILPPPHMGTQVDMSLLDGMGKRDEEFVMVLNLERVFPQNELADVVAVV